MPFKDMPTDSLLDLRSQFVTLASTADITPTQSRNLLIALQLLDSELCARCLDSCLIPEPTPFCQHKLRKAG